MTPLYRNIAIAAALVALPAAAAAAGPERVRALSGRIGTRMRDWWQDDDIAGSFKRLETVGRSDPGPTRLAGRVLALVGVAVLVPAALAVIMVPDRVRQARDRAGAWWTDEDDFSPEAEPRGLSERLESLTGDLERQRRKTSDAVTGAARREAEG